MTPYVKLDVTEKITDSVSEKNTTLFQYLTNFNILLKNVVTEPLGKLIVYQGLK